MSALLIRIKNLSLKFKIIIFFLILTVLFLPKTSYAQTPTASVSAIPAYSAAYNLPSVVSPTSPLYTDLLVHNLFHSFSCLAIGQSSVGQPCLTYQITKDTQGVVQSIPVLSQVNTSGGVLGTTTSLIGILYTNRPVRTVDYLASVGQDMGIIKQANAQVTGSGAAVLNPVLRLWQTSRNISYIILIIVFIIIGFMVMFRTKINPQTVITTQAAIPGLIVGLILITFSYFLAGLVSDMAFIGTNIVGYYFAAAQGPTALAQPAGTNLVQTMSDENVISIYSSLTDIIDSGKVQQFVDSIWPYLNGATKSTLTFLSVFLVGQTTMQTTDFLKAIPAWGEALQAIITIISGAGTAAFPSVPVGIAVTFIASLVLIYTMFKLLLRLLNSYLTIIFLTITAPFQFLVAALPGRQGTATEWILNMLGNILAFPAVIAVLYFAATLVGSSHFQSKDFPFIITESGQNYDNGMTPVAYADESIKIVDTATFPLFGGLNLDFLKILLAFAALTAAPAVPEIVIRAVGKASQAGQLIGQEIGSGTGTGQKYAGQFQQGVATASGLGAKARALSDTPSYQVTGYDPTTKTVTAYDISKINYNPGGISKFKSWLSRRCLPPNTLIATPFGQKTIKRIHIGDLVLTKDPGNCIKQVIVKQVIKRNVPKNYKILKIILADGRKLLVSPGHPDAYGKDLALLRKGDMLDGSLITIIELLPYIYKSTYDILPEGETGSYFANNILIGSTLSIK